MTPLPFSAILFDCDGVLVDSEPIVSKVFRQMLVELGWDIGEQECMDLFVGKSFLDEWRIIHERTGLRIDQDWLVGFRERRDAALARELAAMPGAVPAVRAVAEAMGGRFACASGADRRKIEMQLRIAGLDGLFGDRVFSGLETPRSKPAPDVYLAAAAALGVDPATTAVVEDSVPGVLAGVAAGATVFAFAPPTRTYSLAEHLLEAGAHHIVTSMDDLPALLMGTDALAS
ncbi:HAD family hydrolase [Tessaracoccus antarcticus]|uniref:HAD family phosphatase n=1 Tax=Tessaracoccus antarcticus TaxID=2479848 RepID=A0A3M0G8E9_9ACTN|nr:HAD family phosphatase [Tessaracoccus antarcticus]RMB61184.1 HAD family phosphatase [Tessaracoccus antarcticus]